jgi:hypothetical protein
MGGALPHQQHESSNLEQKMQRFGSLQRKVVVKEGTTSWQEGKDREDQTFKKLLILDLFCFVRKNDANNERRDSRVMLSLEVSDFGIVLRTHKETGSDNDSQQGIRKLT